MEIFCQRRMANSSLLSAVHPGDIGVKVRCFGVALAAGFPGFRRALPLRSSLCFGRFARLCWWYLSIIITYCPGIFKFRTTRCTSKKFVRGCPNWVSQLSAAGPWFSSTRQCTCFVFIVYFRIVYRASCKGLLLGHLRLFAVTLHFFGVHARLLIDVARNKKVFGVPGTALLWCGMPRATPRATPGMWARWYRIALCEQPLGKTELQAQQQLQCQRHCLWGNDGWRMIV